MMEILHYPRLQDTFQNLATATPSSSFLLGNPPLAFFWLIGCYDMRHACAFLKEPPILRKNDKKGSCGLDEVGDSILHSFTLEVCRNG